MNGSQEMVGIFISWISVDFTTTIKFAFFWWDFLTTDRIWLAAIVTKVANVRTKSVIALNLSWLSDFTDRATLTGISFSWKLETRKNMKNSWLYLLYLYWHIFQLQKFSSSSEKKKQKTPIIVFLIDILFSGWRRETKKKIEH